jgi:hypothetical protein
MFTQAIKRWLNTLFGWWPWKKTSEHAYAHAESPLNKGINQEPASRPSIDGVASQGGTDPNKLASRIVGQGETSCSTIEEWPERVIQTPPPPPLEKTELPTTAVPPVETPPAAIDTTHSVQGEAEHPSTPPSTPIPAPTPEQKLEFLKYLVKRGIVNEGFAKGQVPEQYRQ